MAVAPTVDSFLRDGRAGDYLIGAAGLAHPELALVERHGRFGLYRRLSRPQAPVAE